MDGTMAYRMQQVETGLKQLDSKVTRIDDKMDHVIHMQKEHAEETTSSLTDLKDTIEDQRAQLAQWQKSMRQQQPAWKTGLAVGILFLWLIWMINIR